MCSVRAGRPAYQLWRISYSTRSRSPLPPRCEALETAVLDKATGLPPWVWYVMDMTSPVRHERASKPPPLAADGTPRLPHVAYDDEGYPHSDGAPLAQNTQQLEQIVYAISALKTFLHERFPDAFAASDLLIYPRRHDLRASVAPDVFVAFGAGDHARLSYKLWEGRTRARLRAGGALRHHGRQGPRREARQSTLPWASGSSGCSTRSAAGYGTVSPATGCEPAGTGRFHRCRGRAATRATCSGSSSAPRGDNLRIHDPVAAKDLRSHQEANAGAGPGRRRGGARECTRGGERPAPAAARALRVRPGLLKRCCLDQRRQPRLRVVRYWHDLSV